MFYGREKKMELHSQEEAEAIMAEVSAALFRVQGQAAGEAAQPAPPFTTSTLQQEASRKLNMTPARTMSIAQQLYEGVDIDGEGTVGLITYMRTDSLRLSEEAIAAAKGFIETRYGRAVLSAPGPALQDQGQRPGRPRGHPALRREPGARGHQEGPDQRAV